MAEMSERVNVVKLQREIGVPGWVLARAIVYGELSSVKDWHGLPLVDPDEVAEFAKRYLASHDVTAEAPATPVPARRRWRTPLVTERDVTNRVNVVKVQREVGVPGPELVRAIVYGEISAEEDEHGMPLVDPDEVAEFAKRYFASQEPPSQ